MTTGIVFDPRYLDHEQSPAHPERRERLSYTMDQLQEEGLWDLECIRLLRPFPSSIDQVMKVHDIEYLTFLRESSRTGGFIDFDTNIPVNLFESALLAAGGAIRAADAVMSGEVKNAFAMVRPPGHHAHRTTGAGFCYLNNMAIMVRHLQEMGMKRVLVLDLDAHHGDGTQEIFYDDPDVLFISIHQSPFYPGSGSIEETGFGKGQGFTVNMPVPGGTSDMSYLYLLEHLIRPLAEEFGPSFIAISAGQDIHFTDPLTGLALTASGYAEMMNRMVDLSEILCGGRLVAVLEGGYSVEGGLPYTNLGIIAALAGLDISCIREPDLYHDWLIRAVDPGAHSEVLENFSALKSLLSRQWKCFAKKLS
ncbi:MAG TPA: histone deacetylase [Methanoregulaceae archaeon]|nr:histone deacetylase [Methanoregulaceae archaeon]